MFRTEIHRELARTLPDVVGKKAATRLEKLGLHTVDDLIRHVPRRYVSGAGMSSFADLQVGDDVVVVARVASSTIHTSRGTRVTARLEDEDGRSLVVTLFVPDKRAHFLANYWKEMLAPGARGIFSGKVGEFQKELQLTHPDFVMLDGVRITARKERRAPRTKEQERKAAERENREAMGRIGQRSTMIGIYPALGTLRTWTIAELVQMVLPRVTADTLPKWVVEAARQPSLVEAVRDVHEPVGLEQAQRGIARLRFDEAFGIQLAMAHRRRTLASEQATPRPRRRGGLLDALDGRLPFQLTRGQRRLGETLFDELASASPMHRLLQGEVGSGKTLVALRAMCAVVDAGGQAVLVAPTEVLAKQHLASIRGLLGPLADGPQLEHPEGTHVVLLTGSLPAAEKREALQRIATGEAGIVVGTHALFSDPVEFADLGLVVIDEQHRFGVEQRAALSAKGERKPHTLVMTATPIPRSIAMTIFGDLAVSELRELPGGRKPVQTVFVSTRVQPRWVDRAWQRIFEEVGRGRQAFVVCPAIESEGGGDRELMSVTDVAHRLTTGPLRDLRVGVVHGKQPAAERDATMAAFRAGDVDVLVATTVVEVGVDVPNATMMVVLDADRFGISQLHQLRGRVGRGEHPGLCLLLAPVDDDAAARKRLEAVAETRDGFELAEVDLQLRREGDVLGAGQSGGSSLRILRIADVDLIEQAKELAEQVVEDPRSSRDPLLADLLAKAEQVAAGEWLERG